jgi:hypothetical protein
LAFEDSFWAKVPESWTGGLSPSPESLDTLRRVVGVSRSANGRQAPGRAYERLQPLDLRVNFCSVELRRRFPGRGRPAEAVLWPSHHALLDFPLECHLHLHCDRARSSLCAQCSFGAALSRFLRCAAAKRPAGARACRAAAAPAAPTAPPRHGLTRRLSIRSHSLTRFRSHGSTMSS